MESIRAWIESNYTRSPGGCYGYGDGFGNGFDDGSGSGSGWGDGYGDGSGWGDGYGVGSGFGRGGGRGGGAGWDACSDGLGDIKSYCGKPVHIIDGIATIIDKISGLAPNIAKGRILNNDLTTTPCYIAKQDGYFAHGETLRNAFDSLRDKMLDDMQVEERIDRFWAEFSPGQKYPAMLYYEWHNLLTGSCEMGRKQFVRDHGIDLENDEYTPEEFIEITKDAYGGDVIRKLLDGSRADGTNHI